MNKEYNRKEERIIFSLYACASGSGNSFSPDGLSDCRLVVSSNPTKSEQLFNDWVAVDHPDEYYSIALPIGIRLEMYTV